MDINSDRVKSMDRYLRYSLPPGTDGYSMTPETAPLCLTLLYIEKKVKTENEVKTEKEYILIHKKYTGKDGVGRRSAFFVHVLAHLPQGFSLKDAISLWRSPSWQTADTDNRNLELGLVRLARWDKVERIKFAEVEEHLPFIIQAYLTRKAGQRLYIIAESADKVASLISGLAFCLPRNLVDKLTFSTYESDVTKATTDIVGTCWVADTDRDRRAEQVALDFCRREGSSSIVVPLLGSHR